MAGWHAAGPAGALLATAAVAEQSAEMPAPAASHGPVLAGCPMADALAGLMSQGEVEDVGQMHQPKACTAGHP